MKGVQMTSTPGTGSPHPHELLVTASTLSEIRRFLLMTLGPQAVFPNIELSLLSLLFSVFFFHHVHVSFSCRKPPTRAGWAGGRVRPTTDPTLCIGKRQRPTRAPGKKGGLRGVGPSEPARLHHLIDPAGSAEHLLLRDEKMSWGDSPKSAQVWSGRRTRRTALSVRVSPSCAPPGCKGMAPTF